MAGKRPLPIPLTLCAGGLMGMADAVPGVSGGTIALIVGVYRRLLDALGVLLGAPGRLGSPEGRRELGAALRFLLPLGLGLVAAWYVVTKMLVGPSGEPGYLLRAETAPACYAFFFGLVLASLGEPWGRRPQRAGIHLVLAGAAAALAAALLLLPRSDAEVETWMLLYGGAGAITVMLLPGVSGSLLLLTLGQYQLVAGAVHDRDFAVLGVFLLGIGLGLALCVPLLRALLRRKESATLAVLTGLMLGSLVALWPFKANYDPKAGPLAPVAPQEVTAASLWPVLLGLLLGALAVLLLKALERRVREAGAP